MPITVNGKLINHPFALDELHHGDIKKESKSFDDDISTMANKKPKKRRSRKQKKGELFSRVVQTKLNEMLINGNAEINTTLHQPFRCYDIK